MVSNGNTRKPWKSPGKEDVEDLGICHDTVIH